MTRVVRSAPQYPVRNPLVNHITTNIQGCSVAYYYYLSESTYIFVHWRMKCHGERMALSRGYSNPHLNYSVKAKWNSLDKHSKLHCTIF
jgi:hypothetical protein